MTDFKKSIRPGYYVKYYTSRRGDHSLQIRAELYDDAFRPIPGAAASHRIRSNEDVAAAKRITQNRALEKLNRMAIDKLSSVQNEAFFSNLHKSLTDEERLSCVGSKHTATSSRENVATYCSGKLQLLDRYGPQITPDQCRLVSERIYLEVMEKKSFTSAFCTEKEPKSILRFLEELAGLIRRMLDDREKTANVDMFNAVLPSVRDSILKEDRLRSLLNRHLETLGTSNSVQVFAERYSKRMRYDWFNLREAEKVKADILFAIREFCSNENQSKNQANRHISDLNDYIENLCHYSPVSVPPIHLPLFMTEKASQKELAKELDWKWRRRLANTLFAMAEESNYACGGAVMMTVGPRPEEVCAMKFGDINEFSYGGVAVITRTTDGKTVKHKGKNAYFSRYIFLQRFCMDLIGGRRKYLRSIGYTDKQIEESYLCCRSNDEIHIPMSPVVFSERMKAAIINAGCDDSFLRASELDMQNDRSVGVQSVSCYILRRDASTLMCNVACMDPVLVDLILGHKLPKNTKYMKKYITVRDNWPQILAFLNRIVYLPDHSDHPLHAPVSIEPGQRYIAPEAYTGFALELSGNSSYDVVVESVGDVTFKYPADCEVQRVNETALTGHLLPLPAAQYRKTDKKAASAAVNALPNEQEG